MRRRRKSKYYWLPLYGAPNAGDPTAFGTTNHFTLDLSSQEFVVGLEPVVENDVPNQVSEENFPLNDIIGNEYIVKRIVGKTFAAVRYISDSFTGSVRDLPNVSVACAFFVARIGTGQTGTAALPIDAAGSATLYNPLNVGLTREPWVWRRQWLLGAGGLDIPYPEDLTGNVLDPQWGGAFPLQGRYPWNTTHYGSIQDGGHIDAKTGRRVRQDEQLFFAAAATLNPFNQPMPTGLRVEVDIDWDVRVLGALRRAKNRSNF